MTLRGYIANRCQTIWRLSPEQADQVIAHLQANDIYLGEKIKSVSDAESFFDTAILRLAVHRAIDGEARALSSGTK